MGFLDRLLGRTPDERSYHGVPGRPGEPPPHAGQAPDKHGYAPEPDQHPGGRVGAPGYGAPSGAGRRDPDDVAIERYRYLLRTAPPDAVEQAHAEAFDRLSPAQRRQVLDELSAAVPPAERAPSDEPHDLARMATRAEMRRPGLLEQTFRGRQAAGASAPVPSAGSVVGASLLATVASVVIGSAVATTIFGAAFGDPSQEVADSPGPEAGAGEVSAADPGPGTDAGGGFGDASGGGFGGDTGFGGGFGGDVGGF
ncbi:hypothetical protein LEP48_00295 [Isoptericola sp. NEAU-Y5]|uniref:DUF1707 domain-containing protein n=1 Tax=Isoptericola luteus TaxID=2879484 RepID=A0ABS7Z9Q0_9MICO|nr:hypothetical protein [Isoptericola sp. NEAU-Y5]MCA5891790.1 hypothetical protein [Isoptericola sp. NEAU-Y5]